MTRGLFTPAAFRTKRHLWRLGEVNKDGGQSVDISDLAITLPLPFSHQNLSNCPVVHQIPHEFSSLKPFFPFLKVIKVRMGDECHST